MAILISEETQFRSYLDLRPRGEHEIDGQETWQKYRLEAAHGATILVIPHENLKDDACMACTLCRHPTDEPRKLSDLLSGLLAGRYESFSFEPLEPSFQLDVERQQSNEVGDVDGFRVTLWLNPANVETAIFSWDSIGLRFFTSEKNLKRFTQDLNEDFDC